MTRPRNKNGKKKKLDKSQALMEVEKPWVVKDQETNSTTTKDDPMMIVNTSLKPKKKITKRVSRKQRIRKNKFVDKAVGFSDKLQEKVVKSAVKETSRKRWKNLY
eukprot:TRINITY_DN8465_c0_g1_i3.p1 TRINITY_DN8465_c0_g1~~TRINITY_DN8465_c0_g1_i3.p1  ORF type:complete len:105 (-),score=21.13 TRINITY_DN8465_c0_g1_i3:26-340(-)